MIGVLLAYGDLARELFTVDVSKAAGGLVGFAFLASVPAATEFLAVAMGRWCRSIEWE